MVDLNCPDMVLEIAPGANSTPVSLLRDLNAEFLSLPCLYGGVNPYEEVEVQYIDQCKFELRYYDRRFAKHIGNTFLEYKKYQIIFGKNVQNFVIRTAKNQQNLTVNDVTLSLIHI